MSLDPQIADMIGALDSGFPPVHTMTGAQARATIRSRFLASRDPEADPEPLDAVIDGTVPGVDGPVDVRIYRPTQSGLDPLPVLVYAHGGGFVFCDLDSHDGLCRALANLIPAVVISVAYRLAPEHRWPAAAEDVHAVASWAADNAGAIGGDPNRIVVGGDSAGGNLAAVTAVLARDRGTVRLAAQFLLYPMLSADFDTDSHRRFGRGFYNPTEALHWYWDQYVPAAADRANPHAAPLRADLRGLPPAVIVIAGHDPLRDDGVAFADGLQAAEVTTVRLDYDGGIHGFMTMPMLDVAQRARTEACQALAGLLAPATAAAATETPRAR